MGRSWKSTASRKNKKREGETVELTGTAAERRRGAGCDIDAGADRAGAGQPVELAAQETGEGYQRRGVGAGAADREKAG